MKRTVFALVFLLLASLSMASNTGFKLNYPIHVTPGTLGIFAVSLPYLYVPDGIQELTPRASDVCLHAGAGNLAAVMEFVREYDTIRTWYCDGFGDNFDIVPGIGYILLPNHDFEFKILGSHDDDYKPGGPKCVLLVCEPRTLCLNFVSVPYHVRAERASDLCGPNPGLSVIQRYLSRYDVLQSWFCLEGGGGFGDDFDLVMGESLAIMPRGATSLQFDVY